MDKERIKNTAVVFIFGFMFYTAYSIWQQPFRWLSALAAGLFAVVLYYIWQLRKEAKREKKDEEKLV